VQEPKNKTERQTNKTFLSMKIKCLWHKVRFYAAEWYQIKKSDIVYVPSGNFRSNASPNATNSDSDLNIPVFIE